MIKKEHQLPTDLVGKFTGAIRNIQPLPLKTKDSREDDSAVIMWWLSF